MTPLQEMIKDAAILLTRLADLAQETSDALHKVAFCATDPEVEVERAAAARGEAAAEVKETFPEATVVPEPTLAEVKALTIQATPTHRKEVVAILNSYPYKPAKASELHPEDWSSYVCRLKEVLK